MRFIATETDTIGGVRVRFVYIGRMRLSFYRSTDDHRSLCVEVALA